MRAIAYILIGLAVLLAVAMLAAFYACIWMTDEDLRAKVGGTATLTLFVIVILGGFGSFLLGLASEKSIK